MANNDWDLDDLLNFEYDRKIPEKQDDIDLFKELETKPQPPKPQSDKGAGRSFDAYDEYRQYEQLRHGGEEKPKAEKADSIPAYSGREDQGSIFAKYDKEKSRVRSSGRAPVEEPDEPALFHTPKEVEALKQASHDAYERYRSNYEKGKKKRSGVKRVTKFDRILTLLYIIAFGIFALTMTFMNVLPFGLWLAMIIVLLLLSLVILVQTRKRNIKKWGKRLATMLAMLLIVFYGVGTAYAMGTLTFLSESSVDNEKAVSDITRKPFIFTITGIDVDGTIDEQGRSDVNMVVAVNPQTQQILMTSIPRDYEIYMPDFDNAMDKLTHTGFYGVPTTIGAEEQLLDTEINYYVKVNFTTVERFIDAVGGIDVESEYEFNPVKMKDWTVHEGVNHMNGKQALAFARERKAFPDGDRQRIKNQQAVFEALIRKATSSRTMILDYNKVLTGLTNYVEMSFSSREIRKLVKFQLAKDPDWHIYKNTITGGDDTLNTYSAGYAYVMSQDPESIENAKTLINAVLDGQMLQKDEDGNVTVATDEEG